MAQAQDNRDPPHGEPPVRRLHQLPAFWPCVVFLITLGTHGFYVAEMSDHPFFNFPLVDSETYHTQALDIRQNGWLGGNRVFWQAPLYPYFLAFCYGFLDEANRIFDIRVIQMLLAAGNALLLYELGRRRLGRGVAAGAAVAAAFYGPLIYFDVEMLAPVLIVLCYLLMALALDAGIRGGAPIWWWLSGVLNGLATLSHGLAFGIVPLVCLYGLWGGQMRSQAASRRLLLVALFAFGFALAVVPVTIRNRVRGGEWVLISHNGPVNLYIGNHPDYERMVGLRPGLEWSSVARALHEQGILTAGGEARYFLRATLTHIRDHPIAVGRVWLKKIRLLFHADEIKRNYPIYPVREHSHLMRVLLWKWPGPGGILGLGFPFGVVLPLSILGWWVLRRQGIRLTAVELIVAGHVATNLMFFICSRYRVSLAPFLVLYAAAAVHWAVTEPIWRARTVGQNRGLLVVTLLVFLFSNIALSPMDKSEESAEYQFYLGFIAHHYEKKPHEALARYRNALRLENDMLEAHYFLGILYQDDLAKPAEARALFEWVLVREPGNMSVLFYLAKSLASLGEREEAREILKSLVENDPTNEKYRRRLNDLSEKETTPQSGNQTQKSDIPTSAGARRSTPRP